jgi:acetyl-CoA acetyltransferase family protein
MDASRAIMCGDGDVYIAGGVESMTRAPFVMGKAAAPWQRSVDVFDTSIGWRFINDKLSALYYPYTMGETAENVAQQWGITREQQDQFAYGSQEKYLEAHSAGKFESELVAVPVEGAKGMVTMFAKDEHPRMTELEKLATLKPAFKKDGTVTAANSSGINDGAAALLLASEDAVVRYGLTPLASIRSMAIAGVDPSIMGIGPVPATKKALLRAGITVADLDLIELNEAFASQSLACISDLGLDPSKVNVNGGAIALGHPLGCSGARISTTLLHELRRRGGRYALASMCIGVGQGAAIVFEGV